MIRRGVAAIAFALGSLLLSGALFLPSSYPATTATVPVVLCPTTYGVTVGRLPPVPATAEAPAPASTLEVYSDLLASGSLQVFAPRGMECAGEQGADGSTSIVVVPSIADLAVASKSAYSVPRQGVSAMEIPACQGCVLGLACPFFVGALKAFHQAYPGVPCPPQPVGQVAHRLRADAVAFSDPAGTKVPKGDFLVPAHSSYPTNGIVVYTAGEQKSAMEAVCVLPAGDNHVCTEVIAEFLATLGKVTK